MIFNTLLDASVIYSFDQRGFVRHQQSYFRSTDILEERAKGKNIVITGGTGGIGRSVVQKSVELGMNVWLCCRNPQKAQTLKTELIESGMNEKNWNVINMDLGDLDSISTACKAFSHINIDVLVHNAGILPTSSQISNLYGYNVEQATVVNLIAPYIVTRMLSLQKNITDNTRVIWVSSGGMYPVKLDVSSLQSPMSRFDGVQLYAQSKRAEVILAQEFSKEHMSLSMHPGWVDTEGVQNSIPRFYQWSKKHLRTPEQGSDSIVWLAVVDAHRLQNGGFCFDRQFKNPYLLPFTKESTSQRQNMLNWLEEMFQKWQA